MRVQDKNKVLLRQMGAGLVDTKRVLINNTKIKTIQNQKNFHRKTKLMFGSIWCPAPNKAVEQELVLLLVWFGGRPSFHSSTLMLHVCTHRYAHMGMYISRSSTATVLAVLHPRQPPFLLGPCASAQSLVLPAPTYPCRTPKANAKA